MLTMTQWVDIIKDKLGSSYSKNRIRNIIKTECLYSSEKYDGMYQVDGEQVWKKIIMADPIAREKARELRWKDWVSVESWHHGLNRYICNKKGWDGDGFNG